MCASRTFLPSTGFHSPLASSLMAASMNIRPERPHFLLLFLLLTLAAGGCNKPKPGAKCEMGQALCEDTANVLACQGDVFVEAKCRGPGGCSKLGSKITCDDSISEEGDICLEAGSENRACSGDKKTSLLCSAGKFKAVQTCGGPRGCQIKGDLVTCDSKLAEKGDLCTSPGSFACTPDKKARVECGPGGKFAFNRYCRGPSGCHELDFACDETVSEVGDPCGISGMFACNTDSTARLVCQGGQYVKDQPCARGGCSVTPQGRIQCL